MSLAAMCMLSHTAAFCQNITLGRNNATLKEVFKDIREQSGYFFIYDDAILKNTKPISIRVDNRPLDEVLKQCLEGQPLTYEIVAKTIVVRPARSGSATQQKGVLKGRVTDAEGNPLARATVAVAGTTTGALTDSSGYYSLALEQGTYDIIVSYVGYDKVTRSRVQVSSAVQVLDISMSRNTQLQEVVVSYGRQRSREVTGAIAQVNADQLQDMPVTQFSQQLQGKVAGVQINQVSGQPGRGMAFRIRGAASLTAGYQPLFVVDGIPITGDINNINPAEIESYTVLKDAAAAALYGSRAANGVVLITTRHAKPGTMQVDFNANYGIQTIPMGKVPKMMNAREFATFYNELYEDKRKYENSNAQVPDIYTNPERYGEGTNWFDVVTRQAPIQNYDIAVSSASARSRSTVIAGYQRQEGVMVNTGTQLFSFRINQDFHLNNDKLKIGFGLAPSYRFDHNNRMSTDGLAGLFQWALEASPLAPAVNPDGSYPIHANTAGMVTNVNPYAQLMLVKDDYKTSRLLGNAYLDYEFLKGLSLKTSIAVDKGNETRNRFAPSTISTTSIATGNNNSWDNYSWTAETNLQYRLLLKDHSFEALAGYSAQKYEGESSGISAQNFPDDEIEWISVATNITGATSNYTAYSLLSMISRLNYAYKGKYLLSGAIRRDGSSRFGSARRYGNFPSISAGWIISDENFMRKASFLNLLKLRGSYGIAGNNYFGNYTHISTIGQYNYVVNGAVDFGATVNKLGNSELAWERNKQFDIGLDVVAFDNRVSFTYDYYRKTSDGMIQERRIPRSSGFTSINFNTGVFEFWGHELTLNTVNIDGRLKWTSNLNVAFERNRIKSLVSPGFIASSSSITGDYYRHQVGRSIGEFYGFVNLGFYKDAADLGSSPQYQTGNFHSDVGTIKMKDVSGPNGVPDGVIDNINDRTFIGDPTPDFSFGFTNNFTYGNWDLNISMAGAVGGKILNVAKWTHMANLDGARGLLADIKDRWRSEENPGAGMYPRTKANTTVLARYANSQWVEDGTHLAVKNISLGHTFALGNQLLLKNLRVYASVQQALVWSAYSGMNPEISLSGLDATRGLGVDVMAYPVPRTFSLGINARFK